MKKILSISLFALAAMAFIACTGEEDDLFDKSAAERLDDSKVAYTERIAANGGKWAMEYYPTNANSAPTGKGYLMLVEFSSKGWVRVAMNNEMSGNKYMEDTSLWKVIADQGPVLSFNSYNACLHHFSDPAIYDTGLGYEGDYEFEVISLPTNASQAMLKGKKRGTYIRLTALPADTDFEEYLASVKSFMSSNFPSSAINPVYLSLGEKTYQLSNVGTYIADMFPKGGDAITETTAHPFLVTIQGGKYHLRFRSSLSNNGVSYQEYAYDEAAGQFNSSEGKSSKFFGPEPVEFYDEWLTANHKWNLNLTSGMSDDFKAAYDLVNTDLKKLTYSIIDVSFSASDAAGTVAISIRNTKKQSLVVSYLYQYETTGGKAVWTYKEPYTDNKNKQAVTMLTAVPSLQSFLDKLSGSFSVSEFETPFCLNTMKASSDTGVSFIIDYSR